MNYQNTLLDDENQQHNNELSDELIQNLPANAFWVRLSAILCLIFNLSFIAAASFLLTFLPFTLNFSVIVVCLIYFSISLWANWALFDYGNKISDFVRSQNFNDFILAIEKRKLFWQISVWTIISLIVLFIIFLFFVFSFIANNGFR